MTAPGGRLDLIVGARHVSDGLDEAMVRRKLLSAGVIDDALMAGPRAREVVEGGFARLRIEIGPGRLYSWGQGGFRVRCPRNEVSVVADFHLAVRRARGGAVPSLQCSSCGEVHGLNDLSFAPPALWTERAVIFVDVQTPRLTGWGRNVMSDVFGAIHEVPHRPTR